MAVNPDQTATFHFLGKGGKENIYVAKLTPQVHSLLMLKKHGYGHPNDAKLFENVNYKKVWCTYKQYGETPHISRGAYAEALVRQLMEEFKVHDGETASMAVKRFNAELSEKVSAHLNHTRSMTERSYLTETTRQAVNDFRAALQQKVGNFRESAQSEISDALGEAVLWRELGVGNSVI
jgi:hypothetical protein